jgi:4-carboxymuconolactone decarboxylase
MVSDTASPLLSNLYPMQSLLGTILTDDAAIRAACPRRRDPDDREVTAVSRVPPVARADLRGDDQRIYDEIAASRGVVHGPFGVLLHSPELAVRTARLGAYVRYEAPMPARQRHLIALIASRAFDCQYEFTVHAGLAREEGIPAEAVVAIGRGEVPDGLPEDEALVVTLARQLILDHRVADDVFEAIVERVGLARFTDMVGAIAYFSMVAFPLNAFDVGVRAEHTPELPTLA